MQLIKILVLMSIMVLVFYMSGLDEVFFKTRTSSFHQPSVSEWLQEYESERRFQESQDRVLSMIKR